MAAGDIPNPQGRATWHSLRTYYVNAIVRSGADIKTVMASARHATSDLSLNVYASTKQELMNAAAKAAAATKQALSNAACCTGVAREATENKAAVVSIDLLRIKWGKIMVGDTGLEPVTLSLSS